MEELDPCEGWVAINPGVPQRVTFRRAYPRGSPSGGKSRHSIKRKVEYFQPLISFNNWRIRKNVLRTRTAPFNQGFRARWALFCQIIFLESKCNWPKGNVDSTIQLGVRGKPKTLLHLTASVGYATRRNPRKISGTLQQLVDGKTRNRLHDQSEDWREIMLNSSEQWFYFFKERLN